MAEKSLKKNYLYNVSYQILLLLAPLITTPYVSRVLGADGVGTISYAQSIVADFTIFAMLGIPTYGRREVSYHQSEVKARSCTFFNALILQAAAAGIALAVFVPFALHSRDAELYLILGFQILAELVDVTWFFQGLEEFGKIVRRNTFFKILSIVYIFVFVQTKGDLYLYAFGIAFFAFISNLSLWRYLPRYVSRVPFRELHPFRDIVVVLSLFAPAVAIEVYTVLDKTMIGMITESFFENGFYEQAMKVSKMPLVVVTALGTVVVPRIGAYFRQHCYEEIRQLMYLSYRFVWMAGIPMCFGLILTSRSFVPWFFGPGFEKVSDLIDISAFLILPIGMSNATGFQYLVQTGRQKLFTYSVVIGAAVNFVLNLFLIPAWQSEGAAMASVAAELAVALAQFHMVRKELSMARALRQSWHYLAAGLAMSAVLYPLGRQLAPVPANTILLIVTGAAVYMSCLWAMGDDFFKSNVRNVVRSCREKICRR